MCPSDSGPRLPSVVSQVVLAKKGQASLMSVCLLCVVASLEGPYLSALVSPPLLLFDSIGEGALTLFGAAILVFRSHLDRLFVEASVPFGSLLLRRCLCRIGTAQRCALIVRRYVSSCNYCALFLCQL